MTSIEQSENYNGTRFLFYVPSRKQMTDPSVREQAIDFRRKYETHRSKLSLFIPLTLTFRRRRIVEDIYRSRNEIKRLKEGMIHLSTKRRMIFGQQIDWLDSVYDKSIVPFCKAWNLQFATKMQEYLPRELRDMVYGFLWDDSARGEWEDTFYEPIYVSHRRKVQPCGCAAKHAKPIPHFLNPEFVGPATALEMAEAIYRDLGTRPYWLIAERPELIKNVVHNDKFDVGFDPSHYIRAMRVNCKIDRFRTRRTCFKKTNRCQHGPAEKQYIKQRILKSYLAPLLEIKKKSGFHLHIALTQRNLRLAVLQEFLDTIKDVVGAFCQAGGIVTINWLYDADDIGGNDIYLTQEIESYYDTPIQEWQQKIMEIFHAVGGCSKYPPALLR